MAERLHSEAIAKNVLNKYMKTLEAEFQKGRTESAEELWNAFGAIIAVQEPSVETLLYVVEMMKVHYIHRQYLQNLGPASRITKQDIPEMPRPERTSNGRVPVEAISD